MAVTASPSVSSTIGLKNVVIAPLTADTETELTYGTVQAVAGAIEASVTPDNTDPNIMYADDIEFDTLYADPEITFKLKMADIPLTIQEMLFANTMDDNGVLLRTAQDKPPYFAVGFKSEKSNGKFRYVWLYKVRAKPLTENFATKEGDTITRQNPEVEFTALLPKRRIPSWTRYTNPPSLKAVMPYVAGRFEAERAPTGAWKL